MKIKYIFNLSYVVISMLMALILGLGFKMDYFETFMIFGMTALLLHIKKENGENK